MYCVVTRGMSTTAGICIMAAHPPYYPMHIKLDVKDMTEMVALELLYRAPGSEVPYLDHLIIARADEPSRSGVKGEGTHERIVSEERTYTLAGHRIPNFDCAVARAGHDVIVLSTPSREHVSGQANREERGLP